MYKPLDNLGSVLDSFATAFSRTPSNLGFLGRKREGEGCDGCLRCSGSLGVRGVWIYEPVSRSSIRLVPVVGNEYFGENFDT